MNNVDIQGGGFVRLVDALGSDLTVVNSARVSFAKISTQFNDADEKLVRFLAAHKHFSPFRHVVVQFHIKMPEFVARQFYKHIIGSDYAFKDHAWNEMCLSGDTMIRSDGKNYYRLYDLYRKYKVGKKLPSIRSYDIENKQFVSSEIKEVFDRGEQPVFRVTLDNGKYLDMTRNHRVLTDAGWQTLQDAVNLTFFGSRVAWNNGVEVYTNGVKVVGNPESTVTRPIKLIADKHEIVNIEYLGILPTFDIEIVGKHKNFVANNFIVHNSGRYVKYDDHLYEPEMIRTKAENRKQGSLDIAHPYSNYWIELIHDHNRRSYDLYQKMLEDGVPSEQARMILPLTFFTEFYWTASLQAIAHFVYLREDQEAQKEIRDYANAFDTLIREIAPVAWDALMEVNP